MNTTILKVILVLLIVTLIVYILLIRCREHFLDLHLNTELLKNNNNDNITIFKNKIECLDTVKLNILNNNNEELHLLSSDDKTKLNNHAKIMCNEVCDESICTYKQIDAAPPSSVIKLKSSIKDNILKLSWMPPNNTERYVCIINIENQNRIQILNNEDNSDLIEHEINDLIQGKTYNISIIAENSNGLSAPTTKIITIPKNSNTPVTTKLTNLPNSYVLNIPKNHLNINKINLDC